MKTVVVALCALTSLNCFAGDLVQLKACAGMTYSTASHSEAQRVAEEKFLDRAFEACSKRGFSDFEVVRSTVVRASAYRGNICVKGYVRCI